MSEECWDDDWVDQPASTAVYVPPPPVETFVDVDKYTIKVNTNKVGSIIGSGGSKIRELQDQSRARIIIGAQDGGYTIITFKGNNDQINNCKRLIDDWITLPQVRMTKKEREYNNTYGEKSVKLRLNKFNGLQRHDQHHWLQDIEKQTRTKLQIGSITEFGDEGEIIVKGKLPDVEEAISQIRKIDLGPEIDPEPTMEELNELYHRKEQHHWSKIPKIIKNVYVEDRDVSNMSQEEVERIREQNNNTTVSVFGSEDSVKIPNPVTNFRQAFKPYPEILQELDKLGFTSPSPIQAQAWPILMSGHDMIGIAQTGTGKTFAFLLPALVHTIKQTTPVHERRGPSVLIMAPTRELATQIEREVNKINYKGLKAVCVYGGKDSQTQINKIEDGCQILIATPGRLNDFVQRAAIDMMYVSFVVLDEADRMLDLGFEPQINRIHLLINPNRQTVLTSATWSSSVQRVANKYTKNPVKVNVGSLDLAATHTVSQRIIFLDSDDDKEPWLYDFIANMGEKDKIMVFIGRKATVSYISSELALKMINACALYGDLSQEDRELALDDITSGHSKIMIATDVASRGLDVNDLTHVINYDFPRNIEEYVHRVGRTGRAGKFGESITLMTRKDWGHAAELIPILEEADQEVPQELIDMAERFKNRPPKPFGGGRGGRGGRGGGFRSNDDFGGGNFGGGRRNKW